MATILVTGATGFVGQALLAALTKEGHTVRATTRDLARSSLSRGTVEVPQSFTRPQREATGAVEWVQCDVTNSAHLARALRGIDVAYFLVHAMGSHSHNYTQQERLGAQTFAAAAATAGCKRVIYLGGVAPARAPSAHLKSRLDVGQLLRAGPVPTLELRASMIIGPGSASWQIVRDLTLRMPLLLLPPWTSSRTCPIAIQDVIVALVRALDVPLSKSAWYDIPGPEVLRGTEMIARLAALRGRRARSVKVPYLAESISSLWLKLLTRTDYGLARELARGFTVDLLPQDARYWDLIDYHPLWTYEAAARYALNQERPPFTVRDSAIAIGEWLVDQLSPKL
jgi:uncharacterized protein YbjT (DUF2867 family)